MITNYLNTTGNNIPKRVFTATITGEQSNTTHTNDQETAITTMIVCNVGMPDDQDETVNSATITIYLVKNGAPPDNILFSNAIVSNLTIPAGETVFFSDERIILDGGDMVYIGASAANLITSTVSTIPV